MEQQTPILLSYISALPNTGLCIARSVERQMHWSLSNLHRQPLQKVRVTTESVCKGAVASLTHWKVAPSESVAHRSRAVAAKHSRGGSYVRPRPWRAWQATRSLETSQSLSNQWCFCIMGIICISSRVFLHRLWGCTEKERKMLSVKG